MESGSMEVIEIKLSTEISENFTGIVKYSDGPQCWYLNGLYHREDGPAIIGSDGTQFWYLKGEKHREDGPAIIYPDGRQYWYFNDEEITPMELFEKLSDEQKEKALWNLNQWR